MKTLMNAGGTMESPFACVMTALTPEQHQRHSKLLSQMIGDQQEIVELGDGYALRFIATPQLFQDLAEFVVYEHLCCSFFDLDLSLERENGRFGCVSAGALALRNLSAAN
jgi:hypothetical protein